MNCPNCKEKELHNVSDTEKYCDVCDLTFTVAKGKTKVDTDKKGKIQELEEEISILKVKIDKTHEKLFGDKDEDLF